ncbi:MAG: hypothetical protein ACR2I0_15220 [Rhodoferax sp.]
MAMKKTPRSAPSWSDVKTKLADFDRAGLRDLKGLLELCQQKAIDRGYVVTKSLDDFGAIADLPDTTTRILRIPAPLLCYWMGESELTPEQQ